MIPVPGCPKLMYNGPCAGGSGGSCEVHGKECPWVTLFLENPSESLFTKMVLDEGFKVKDHKPRPRKPATRLMEKIAKGGPVITYEFVAGAVGVPDRTRREIGRLKGVYDALHFVDNPLGYPHVSPLAPSTLALELGVTPVAQFSCKDRSRNALVSDLLAAGFLGIKHVLLTTGDWPHIAGSKYTRPVFDLDSIRLVYLTRLLTDLGVDYRGRKLDEHLFLHIAVAFNPHFKPIKLEITRLLRKQEAGAEYAVTQPVFSVGEFSSILKEAVREGVEIPVIPSIALIRGRELLEKLGWLIGAKPPRKYLEAVGRLDSALNYLETLASELYSLEGVPGIHVLTLGDNEAGRTLGERIRESIG